MIVDAKQSLNHIVYKNVKLKNSSLMIIMLTIDENSNASTQYFLL